MLLNNKCACWQLCLQDSEPSRWHSVEPKSHLLELGEGVPWKAVLATRCRQDALSSAGLCVLICVPAVRYIRHARQPRRLPNAHVMMRIHVSRECFYSGDSRLLIWPAKHVRAASAASAGELHFQASLSPRHTTNTAQPVDQGHLPVQVSAMSAGCRLDPSKPMPLLTCRNGSLSTEEPVMVCQLACMDGDSMACSRKESLYQSLGTLPGHPAASQSFQQRPS